MKFFLLVLFLLLTHFIFAQTITLTPLQGNKQQKIIKEKSLLYINYKRLPDDLRQQKIQGRLVSLSDTGLTVKPLFKKEVLIIHKDQILKIKKENLAMLMLGAAAFTAGTFFLVDQVEGESASFLFYTILVAPSAFILVWNHLINPMKNVAPANYSKNNQWNIKLEK